MCVTRDVLPARKEVCYGFQRVSRTVRNIVIEDVNMRGYFCEYSRWGLIRYLGRLVFWFSGFLVFWFSGFQNLIPLFSAEHRRSKSIRPAGARYGYRALISGHG